MMRSRVFVAAAVLGVSVISVTTFYAQDGKVSGALIVNGTKVPVRHITAVTYDTPSQGRMVSVLVSDKPVDPKTFQEYTRIGPGEKYVAGMITGAWVTMHSEDKAFSGFQFTLDDKRRVMLNDVLVGARDDNFSFSDDYLVLDLTSVTPRLVGRLRTKEPIVTLNTQKVGMDLTFDAPVMAIGK